MNLAKKALNFRIKLLADVGLVGQAGKSTLLSVVSALNLKLLIILLPQLSLI